MGARLYWLFEAKKRYGVRVLNYMVTSNHVHLLLKDGDNRSVIANTMQLIAGRTGQEYNARKGRRGLHPCFTLTVSRERLAQAAERIKEVLR